MLTTSSGARTLRKTLENIITDSDDGIGSDLDCSYFMKQESMDKNYVQDLERGGPGLLTETPEAMPLDELNINDGALTTYISRKFGGLMTISEEMEEDGQYNSTYFNGARTLKRAGFKTLEVDTANVLNRGWNTGFVGGDGLPLFSASHTIPGGGTFSNTLAVPMAPSVAALNTVRQNVGVMVGHDGQREGYKVMKIVHPWAQDGAWETILGTKNGLNTSGQDLNVVANKGYTHRPILFWTASDTNWAVITDAPNGLKLKWRRKFKARTWYEERPEVHIFGVSGRWARGWSNPRGAYGSEA